MPTVRDLSPASAMILLAIGASPIACSAPNPAFDGSGQADASATGTASQTATEGSADESGNGSGGEVQIPPCGNGDLDPGEQCDDGNADNDDGCLFNCVIPKTCAEILELAPSSGSGTYHIDPGGSGEPWAVACDMVLDGGGWTGFQVQDTCNGHLTSEIVALVEAPIQDIDDLCRPFMEYPEGGGTFGYYWDIDFPPGFSAFFLREYSVRAIGEPELKFPQELWETPFEFPDGSLSLGDAHEDGPIANWVTDGGTPDHFALDETKLYPRQESPFELAQSSTTLRIGWGETGVYHEGLYPWWSGLIFVR